ncbi:uncharacterized protein LOC142982721 [Anticarsia gemmatalis]|uniref:uncharacterized protein LOC142982721 n=1 Tax=Anticarsia gemmatalis TaxID=129554 RepID=UPI003F7608F6
MDLIEVDPKLFVTCRLCLEDLGQYQIIPKIKEQIKYCFDIDVDPFDGLPQLICLKCKEILTNFYTLKKLLSEKQADLHNKITKKQINGLYTQQPQDIVSSSQQIPEHTTIKRPADSSDTDNSVRNKLTKKKKKKQAKTRHQAWDCSSYNRDLVCTICHSHWPSVRSFNIHCRVHIDLKIKYPNVFLRNCSVMLDKIDDKPNFIGNNNIVVHDSNNIIQHCNKLYYIRYSKQKSNELNENNTLVFGSKYPQETQESSDTSDSDQDFVVKPRGKTRRLLSKSSNDTVVIDRNIESDNEEESKDAMEQDVAERQTDIDHDYQCISINSSDSDTDRHISESTQKAKQPIEARLRDYKVIQGIISMCVSSYHKKIDNTEKSACSESQLKRKVLSIGRKIINKRGINCTGILRYVEQKHRVNIIWVPKALPVGPYIGKESEYVRLIAILNDNNGMDDNIGWIPLTAEDYGRKPNAGAKVPSLAPLTLSTPSPTAASQSSQQFLSPSTIPVLNQVTLPVLNQASLPVFAQSNVPMLDKTTSSVVSQQSPTTTENLNHNTQPMQETALIYFCTVPDSKNKLLNANPVANPKQLPRKLLNTDSRNKTTTAVSEQFVTFQNDDSNNMCMPIITSTTSLAESANVEEHQTTNTPPPVATTSKDIPAPRIKVKPVTELMSERTLSNMRSENLATASHSPGNVIVCTSDDMNRIIVNQNVWPSQTLPNVYLSNVAPQGSGANQPIQIVNIPCLEVGPKSPKPANPLTQPMNKETDQVVLDTVELPNVRTKSPVTYFINLLQLHNLTLSHSVEIIPGNYICLIKFRVNFKQQAVDEPVEVCLSLYYNNVRKRFCFNVRDKNKGVVNLNKVSSNWQWEILTILLRADLLDKLLNNAHKHSKDTYLHTNKFICLLKSIKFTKCD